MHYFNSMFDEILATYNKKCNASRRNNKNMWKYFWTLESMIGFPNIFAFVG